MEGSPPYSSQQDGESPSGNSRQGVANISSEEQASSPCDDACLTEYGDRTMAYAQTNVKRIGGSAGPSPLGEALVAAGRAVSQFIEARRGRREILRLASFEDSMLADIGIARSDVEWALMQPWNADPSLALEHRINRRKESVRWARSYWAN
jgi:uncharacterized protein YjiS (DUF1127 family)